MPLKIKDDCLEITETSASEEVRVSEVLNPWRLESFFQKIARSAFGFSFPCSHQSTRHWNSEPVGPVPNHLSLMGLSPSASWDRLCDPIGPTRTGELPV